MIRGSINEVAAALGISVGAARREAGTDAGRVAKLRHGLYEADPSAPDPTPCTPGGDQPIAGCTVRLSLLVYIGLTPDPQASADVLLAQVEAPPGCLLLSRSRSALYPRR